MSRDAAAPPFRDMRLLRRRGPVEVFAGVDPDGRRALVRRFDPEAHATDPVGAARFRRELVIAAALDHPGVVARMAAGDDWLALEWLEDGLDDPARGDAFREPAALGRLVAEVAGTLAYLHARGIVHADLKPAHIRFRGARPVLADFGIAALVADDALSGREFAGSPRWMAPELLDGAAATPASDVWSLCAIAAWLWNGAPAPAGDADAILAARRSEPAARMPELAGLADADPALSALLEAGLGPPALRPSAAGLSRL